MIVIIGASGMVGGPAIKALLAKNATIRAMTSNETSAARLRDVGVAETIIGDFRKEGEVERAVAGAEKVIFVPPAMVPDQAEIGKRVVAACKAQQIRHFVFISCVHPQIEAMAHHWHKLRIEEAVVEGGFDYTILQPSMFMQNLNFIWSHIVQDGAVRWLWDPSQRFNFVDTRDLAETIAISVTTDRLLNGSFEICSADTLSIHETASIISDVWGKPLRAERQPQENFITEMRRFGMAEWRIQNMVNMAHHYDLHGYTGGNPLVATAILGRAPISYRTFVRDYLAEKAIA
jgi:NAD(P)H dehydrogenase (quinone)